MTLNMRKNITNYYILICKISKHKNVYMTKMTQNVTKCTEKMSRNVTFWCVKSQNTKLLQVSKMSV